MRGFEVSLNNSDSMFDSMGGFETLEEALKWAVGHGGKFNILVNETDDGKITKMLHYAWNGRLMQRDMFGWRYVKTPK